MIAELIPRRLGATYMVDWMPEGSDVEVSS
jgi:hypothetical protein